MNAVRTGVGRRRRAVVRMRGIVLVLVAACAAACAPRLKESDVTTRLSLQLNLPAADIRVRSISADSLPVARIEYGGAVADVRFRRQQGTWVIDAVARGSGWQAAEAALPVLATELVEKARERWMNEVMPRYAGTFKLLVGWSELLGSACGSNLPTSEVALLNLHAQWHRTLFPNRGVMFHNSGLFLRDGWRRALRAEFAASRTVVTSAGADGKFDTADDVRLSFARGALANRMYECGPRYTIPGFAAAALGRSDAPSQWNCADMLAALQQAQALDIVEGAGR